MSIDRSLTHEEVNCVSDIKRKKNESFESFFRRVKQQWLRSGKILQVRKVQFFTKKKSKNEQRKNAVEHAKIMSKTRYLQKTGKMPVEEERSNNQHSNR